jgi:hypothetical protein
LVYARLFECHPADSEGLRAALTISMPQNRGAVSSPPSDQIERKTIPSYHNLFNQPRRFPLGAKRATERWAWDQRRAYEFVSFLMVQKVTLKKEPTRRRARSPRCIRGAPRLHPQPAGARSRPLGVHVGRHQYGAPLRPNRPRLATIGRSAARALEGDHPGGRPEHSGPAIDESLEVTGHGLVCRHPRCGYREPSPAGAASSALPLQAARSSLAFGSRSVF